jgi:hypothetical protein
MSTTQEPEVNFHDQINDLIRCFKYLNIFDKNHHDNANFFIEVQPSNPGEQARRVNVQLKRESSIVPDTEANLLVKGKLKLVPARLDLKFTSDYGDSLNCSPFSEPLDSDIVNKIADNTGKDTISESLFAWYASKSESRFVIDLNKLSLTKIALNLKWKVYHPVDDEVGDEILYIHFPVKDTWVVMRFSSLSGESDSIQILNEYKGYIADCNDLKFNYKINGPTFIESASGNSYDKYSTIFDLDTQLDNGALFDTKEVSYAAAEVVDKFKEAQDDSYIDADLLESEELNFICGSEENLEEMLTLICHAGIPLPAWKDQSSLEIHVNSAMDAGEGADIDYDNMEYDNWSGIKEGLDDDKIGALENAFDAALDKNQPCGHTWEYNDGPYDRQSGYDRSALRLTFDIPVPSAHEQICAKIEIKKLEPILGKSTVQNLLK